MRTPATLALLALSAIFVAGCASYEFDKTPPFYETLNKPGAEVDIAAAASLISDYRRASNLPAVEPDEKLTAIARDHVRRMVAADRVTHDPGGRVFQQRLKSANYEVIKAAENVGAGYHTLAEAFSGWRDSPSHNTNLLLPDATRFGIATAYSAKSKYRVFWALVLAEPKPAQ